jgi:hypothetical protein
MSTTVEVDVVVCGFPDEIHVRATISDASPDGAARTIHAAAETAAQRAREAAARLGQPRHDPPLNRPWLPGVTEHIPRTD